MSLRCTVQVVTTEDAARYLGTIEQHVHITAYIRKNIAFCSVFSILLSQTATKDITVDGTPVKVHIYLLCSVKDKVACRLAGIYIS